MPRPSLTIFLGASPATKPFRSSRLAVPPSPISPRSPLFVLSHPHYYVESTIAGPERSSSTSPPPPAKPLRWLWQCHQCSRIYVLATTRRCLDDGHYFCAGTVTYKRDRKTGRRKQVKSRACASEFDYAGWKVWGNWRRSFSPHEDASGGATNSKKNCAHLCDYPSECRWGQQYGVAQSNAQTTVELMDTTPEASNPTFDDILATVPVETVMTEDVEMTDAPAPVEAPDTANVSRPSLDDLLTSVKRRERLSTGGSSSPLAAAPTAQSEESGKSAKALQKAFDDFELDVRKGLGKASELVAGLGARWK